MSELKHYEVPCGCRHPVADLAGPVDDSGCDYPTLKADNARLRALVKDARSHDDNCPWCGAFSQQGFEKPCAPDCPAFTPEGEVR